MAIMVYALYTYHWRAASILRGGRGPYDDRVGPVSFQCSLVGRQPDFWMMLRFEQTILCVALLGRYFNISEVILTEFL